MNVLLNGSPASLDVSNIPMLLLDAGIDPSRSGIAVAVNDRIVPRAEWETTVLEDGDRIEIITAMQGG